MRRSIKLYVLRQSVESAFSEAIKFSSSSLVPMSDSEINKVRIGIAEDFLHLKHHHDNFFCIS